MDLQLTGLRALVTGSTAGIGFAIAERLAAEGADVVITGRTQARVDAAIAEICGRVRDAVVQGVACDFGTPAGCARAIEAAPDLDILVNNVGMFTPKAFVDLTDADWMTAFTVNVMSGVILSRHHLPRMLTKKSGRIIFISSESALQIPTEMIQYGVSKTAQSAVARGLAELTRATGVTVNSVLAGPTRSEGVERFVGDLARVGGIDSTIVERDFFRTARPSSLLQRFITPDEIANVVAFIASPLAAAVNGAAVRADGGVLKSTF
jgi:NAD(P)-dependent dehydrogenase (short-subunit alcohol dehydrogenase family)